MKLKTEKFRPEMHRTNKIAGKIYNWEVQSSAKGRILKQEKGYKDVQNGGKDHTD